MKMPAGSEDRNKIVAVAAFLAIALGVLYWEVYGGSSPTPASSASAVPAVVRGHSAKTVGTTSAGMDPTLHMDAMLVSESVEYSGSGRNIFSPNSAPPVVIPKPIAQARLQPVVHPGPPVQTGPPPPPPIDLKFFGMVTSSSGSRQAMLLHGDDVFLASRGDIVQRKYRVVDIGPNSIQVEDMSNNNRQTLPLQATP